MTTPRVFFFIGCLCAVMHVSGQVADTETVFSVNNREVTAAEFKAVYTKNLDLVQDPEQKKVENYLDLYTTYKLKVDRAYALGLHKKESYKKELDGYRRQLARNYMSSNEVTTALVKEAYDHTVEEVRGRHILVQVDETALPEDTLTAYGKINRARNRVLQGEDFAQVAKEISEDPSAQKNGGDLGWFKAFKMVYPFEKAAYKTPVGSVSEPFRTRFGYHIVQTTHRRTSEGEVIAAHIMIALKQKDSTVNPEERIKELYQMLQQGSAFGELATKYSDDKKSAMRGGRLNKFSRGQLSSAVFEDVVFALPEEGAVSKPFKTDFGWHIAKLIERFPVAPFEAQKANLEKRVKNDGRGRKITSVVMDELKGKYGLEVTPEALSYFESLVTDDVLRQSWNLDGAAAGLDEALFTFKDSICTYREAANYLERRQLKSKKYPTKTAYIKDKLEEYLNSALRSYHIAHLEEQNPVFANVMREYKEGLLLFDLMETEVWNKAKKDTVGLQQYFEAHRKAYEQPKMVEVRVTTSPDSTLLDQVASDFKEGKQPEEIKNSYNKEGNVKVFINTKQYTLEEALSTLPKALQLDAGYKTTIASGKDYAMYEVLAVTPKRLQTLEEARLKVISDYQAQLEGEWIKTLHKNATIKINKPVLKRLVKELEQ